MEIVDNVDNRSQILRKFYKVVLQDSGKARKLIKLLPFKHDAYLLCCIALTYKDEAMFITSHEMRKIFSTYKLKLALKYIELAAKLKPCCRDILYLKGIILNALGDTWGAIDCYLNILKSGRNMHEDVNCSNSDLSTVKMILNDSRFQLYRLFYDLEDYDLSKRFLSAYKRNLRKGVGTMYEPLNDYLMGDL